MKKTRILCAFILTVLVLAALCACDKKGDVVVTVDYATENDFPVETVESDDALCFLPKGVKPKFGLIFYVGTMLAPAQYSYLGEALARQGYAVVMPIVNLNMTFTFYKEQEAAYQNFKDVTFFLGGHSQGGGAAVRRAEENKERTAGVILLAPLCQNYTVFDEHGESLSVHRCTLVGASLPTLLIEASADRVLNEQYKRDARERLDPDFLEARIITPGAHMSFSTHGSDSTLNFFLGDGDGITEEQKNAQRAATISYVLDFMKRVILNRFKA